MASTYIGTEEVSYKFDVVAGVEGLWIYPKDADLSKVIIYTHGGGFAVGSSASHRKLVGHLAKYLGVSAFVVDYRRSPEHVFPAQIQDVTAVYKELLQRGFTAKNMLTAGDSAGGIWRYQPYSIYEMKGLSCQAVIAFSPWLDMEHKGETLISNDATDALITVDLLKGMSQMFLVNMVIRQIHWRIR
jgi:acetyl esterase/lipase